MTNTRNKRRRNCDNKVEASTIKNKPNPIDLKSGFARFMEASEKRHDTTNAVLRDPQASLCNQQACILDIEKKSAN